jgi:hypothetical protein
VTKAGDEIVNPRTGQRMVFLKIGTETGGELLRIDSYNPPSPPLLRPALLLAARKLAMGRIQLEPLTRGTVLGV